MHVALYAAILVAWALFWFAAAVVVNAWSSGSARNALLLVGLWLLLVVIVPGLVSVALDSFSPAPSRTELVHEVREAAQEIERELAGLEGRHDVDPRTRSFSKKLVAVEEKLVAQTAPMIAEHHEKVRERQELLGVLRFSSPALVVQLALEDVAGSGATRHQRFAEQVETFHGEFRGFFTPRIDAGQEFTTADLDALPKMAFQEEPAATLAGRVLVGIALLLLSVFAMLGLAWPGLRRVGRLTR